MFARLCKRPITKPKTEMRRRPKTNHVFYPNCDDYLNLRAIQKQRSLK